MGRKRASEIFGEVDPHLKVINGGTHRKSRLTLTDWDKVAGVICPKCGQEVFRMIGGICFQCYRGKVAEDERKKEDRAERRYYKEQLRKGTISLAQMREGRL